MFQKITRRNLEKFLQNHATEERTLDIGSGGSSYERFFPNRVSLDVDPARKPDIIGDVYNLPFESGAFKVVLCTEVLEHLKDPTRAIEEMNRVLAHQGTLILTTRFVYPLHDTPGDYWRFTEFGLRELFRTWDICELYSETESFSTVAVLLQRLAFQTNLRWNKFTKLVLFLLAWIFDHLNGLIQHEYGDIRKSKEVHDILTSGYHLVCRKI